MPSVSNGSLRSLGSRPVVAYFVVAPRREALSAHSSSARRRAIQI
jgi:hypothetical protein